MQLKDLYHLGKKELKRSSVESPGREISILLLKLGVVKAISDIYVFPEKDVGKWAGEQLFQLIKRRMAGEPMAYVVGEKEFYSRTFEVNSQVLIPRPETEILVEETLKVLDKMESPTILEVGTGSGCLAVTLACEHDSLSIYATDISFKALSVAGRNARRHNSHLRIVFVNADLSYGFKGGKFGVVVSNPPYVSEGEFHLLEPDVKDYEPRKSLLAGEDGLYYIKNIISNSRNLLKGGGWCLLEVGQGQDVRVDELFEEYGFHSISSVSDISNIGRVVKAKWKK